MLNKAIRDWEWCIGPQTKCEVTTKRVNCPRCKRRFIPVIYGCDDDTPNFSCLHAYIPQHKTLVKRAVKSGS